jgi:hypothetical protein
MITISEALGVGYEQVFVMLDGEKKEIKCSTMRNGGWYL